MEGFTGDMKIALAQTRIIWEDKDKNLNKAEKIIQEQAILGTQLVLFPEMSFTGFSMNTGITKEGGCYTEQKMKQFSAENNISIGYGWVKDCGDKCENHYSVVNQEGTVVSDYIKIHPFSYSGEDKRFYGGEKTCIFELNGIKFSTFLCYDLRFPEVFQAVSDYVTAVIVPANWPAERSRHWKTLLQARAIENQVYVAGINCTGRMDGTDYSGGSCMIDPDGNTVQEAGGNEGAVTYDLKADVQDYRKRFPARHDRNWKLYRNLYEQIYSQAVKFAI